MKGFYIFTFLLSFLAANAQAPFITTWTVFDNNTDIKIPTREDYTYNYTVDFGDGTVLINQTGDVVHNYASEGTYTVSISGDFPLFNGVELDTNLNSVLGYSKLRSVEQWGDIEWLSMEDAFNSCQMVVINATDTPDLSQVNSMRGMFQHAFAVNQSINHWDVSNITDMSNLFYNAESFNQALDQWDVSNVLDMSNMFNQADNFNQDIASWQVHSVVDMSGMFFGASSFDQPLNTWDVSNVTDISDMFRSSQYNRVLSAWDTSNVIDLSGIFSNSFYNQPLNSWNVSNVIHMDGVFSGSPYNYPLNNWDVSNVTSMAGMFSGSSFNQPLNDWDVSNVTNISYMFNGSAYNQPLDNWDVSNVTDMKYLFTYSIAFNQALNTWDVSAVTNMKAMFYDTHSFNQPLNNWDVSNVGSFDLMFSQAQSFDQDLSNWNFTDFDLYGFISESAMSPQNYDLLLDRLDQLSPPQNTNKYIGAYFVYYCDRFTRQSLEDKGWWVDDMGPSSGCEYKYIYGSVMYDDDDNGCDSNDLPLSKFMVNASDGVSDIGFETDEEGGFLLEVIEGNYTIEIQNLHPNFDSTPVSHNVVIDDTTNSVFDIDFCVTASQQFDDLGVDIIPLNDAIPGFESHYQIIAYNYGSQAMANVEIMFSFDNLSQTFVSSSQTPDNSDSGSATFVFPVIEPFSSEVIEITLLNAIPPTLESSDVLNFSAEITPDTNDYNLKDNLIYVDQEVINSFDPNDKLVVQGNEISEDNIGEYLDYRIRFQNVGTAHALNVIITDTISEHLDWSTFQPISSSHDYRVELINQEEINFIFENIYLPYEALDQEGSNGYVTFKIKPKHTVEIGDVIENTAYIYFDFNAPIITNTVNTSIVDKLSTASFGKTEIKLYPNPVQNNVYVETPSSSETLKKVEIYNLNGKLVFKKMSFLKDGIDVQFLERGVYIIRINENWVRKLIKE